MLMPKVHCLEALFYELAAAKLTLNTLNLQLEHEGSSYSLCMVCKHQIGVQVFQPCEQPGCVIACTVD